MNPCFAVMTQYQDLDNPAAIGSFVRRFYSQLLADPQLAPIFLDVARIDIDHHLPLIEAFWRKLLLGEKSYDRHMMNIHRAVHQRHPFTAADFARWLQYFNATLDEGYAGPGADRARVLARSIAHHLQEALLAPHDYGERTHRQSPVQPSRADR